MTNVVFGLSLYGALFPNNYSSTPLERNLQLTGLFRVFMKFAFLFQVHSLTARSMPYQFREGLRNNLPKTSDKNIRLSSPVSSETSAIDNSEKAKHDDYHDELHIIYDSRKTSKVSNPRHVVRTQSPEHVGIPAGPIRIPPSKKGEVPSSKPLSKFDYTSDDSNGDSEIVRLVRHPPSNRRKVTKSSYTTRK